MKKLLSILILCALAVGCKTTKEPEAPRVVYLSPGASRIHDFAPGNVVYTNIGVGTAGNDGTGDSLRLAFQKVNQGFLSISNNIATNSVVGKLDHTAGTGTNLTLVGTNLVTARGSTTARGLEDRFADEVNVSDNGFTDDGSTDNSTVANTLFAASHVSKKTVRFTKSRSGTGVYLFNSTVNITNDVQIVIDPGVTIKRGDTATGFTWHFRVPQTMGIKGGVFDGNKANNSLSANRYPMIRYYGTPTAVIEGGYTTNHITGFYDVDSSGGWTMRNWGFFNAAEHEGTLDVSGLLWHHTEAVNVSVAIADARPHFNFENITIKQDAAPSTTGKGPGGIIISGNIASNSLVSASFRNINANYIGQTFPRSGGANHIAGIHAYEGTHNIKIENCHGENNQYGFIQLQNSLAPIIIGNTVRGMAAGILEADGTAGILVDVNRTLGDASTNYGRATISANQVFNVGLSPGIRVAGRGTASADEYLHAILEGNYVDNPTGRALQLVSVGGTITVKGGTYSGAGPSSSGGAVELQNLDSAGEAFFDGVKITSYAFTGLYANSGVAGSVYVRGGHIKNAGSGTTAALIRASARASIKGTTLDGTGGVAYNIPGANILEWSGVNVVSGTRTVDWANVGAGEGILEGNDTPEGSVLANVGTLYRRLNGGTGTTLYIKESDSGGTANNTGWVAVAQAAAGSGDDVYINGSNITHPDFDDATYIKFVVSGTNVTAYATNLVSNQIVDGTLTADDLGADSVSASELNAAGVASELEAAMALQNISGAVTDGQVPNTITVDLATLATTATTANAVANNSVTGAGIALGSQAAGDVMYYDGTDWVRLAKGTAGQVLEMNAGATAPEWDTDDSGGSGDNWTASGTTNSTLPGIAYAHEYVRVSNSWQS
jgi:hypothetical protein